MNPYLVGAIGGYLIGMAYGYFACHYINQFAIKAGRAAIAKATGGAA